MAFSGCPRGLRVGFQTKCLRHIVPNFTWLRLALEPGAAPAEPTATAREDPLDGAEFGSETLKLLVVL